MDLIRIIKEEYDTITQDEYKGVHTAPYKETGSPMYDLTMHYDEDIYSDKAVRYYGTGYWYDQKAIDLIHRVRNKPDAQVMVYRAIPKVISAQDKIKFYQKHLKYMYDKQKLPPSVKNWQYMREYYDFIQDELERLSKEASNDREIKINNRDWVAIMKEYAIDHGRTQLDGEYRILKKVTKAKYLFNDGNSFQEWGIDES